MNPYYTIHIMREKDTINSIASLYQSSVSAILTANPELNPFLLHTNRMIIVPRKKEIVTPEKAYDYMTLKDNLMALKIYYPFLDTDVIGQSVGHRDIYSVSFGKGTHTVLYNASHHGNEWITSLLLMKWLENMCLAKALQGSIRGYAIDDLFEKYKIVIVPMVNPDGVELVIHGLESAKYHMKSLLRLNHNNPDFTSWKANLKGVDLNRNYDAGWDYYKKMTYKWYIDGPGPAGFPGFAPHSEPETLCLSNLTLQLNPRLTLSYHAQGEEIFWKFSDRTTQECGEIAQLLSKTCGYLLANESQDQAYAGYKDWFIHVFQKPGYTIEVGRGRNPLHLSQFDDIYEKNEALLLLAAVI
ncbi:MAG: peptidase M14 [Vallitaleaceae bacterium]|nr:peptidase M14 [Vallitaleaceae bacterium]